MNHTTLNFSHHHEVDCPFDSSGGFRRSQHINSDTAIAPCTLGPSSCALERGDGVRGGGAGTCSVKQSHFSEPKARTPTEELSSKPPPSVCSPPSQDRCVWVCMELSKCSYSSVLIILVNCGVMNESIRNY